MSISYGELFWGIFCQFCISLLFYVPLFLENHSIASYKFFYMYSLYYSQGCLTKKTVFFYWESFSGTLGLILIYVYSFLRRCSILCYEILFKRFLYYSENQCAKKNFTAFITLIRGTLQYFWACSEDIPPCLGKHKTFF